MTNDIARSFGAEVNLALPDSDQQHLFLIKSSRPISYALGLVNRRGGGVMIQSKTWIVAQLPYELGMGLKQEPGQDRSQPAPNQHRRWCRQPPGVCRYLFALG